MKFRKSNKKPSDEGVAPEEYATKKKWYEEVKIRPKRFVLHLIIYL